MNMQMIKLDTSSALCYTISSKYHFAQMCGEETQELMTCRSAFKSVKGRMTRSSPIV